MMRGVIQQQLRAAVEGLIAHGPATAAATDLLQREGYPLHADAPCRAGVLAFIAYRVAGGTDENIAATCGAVAELFMAASYTLDHRMDGDVTASADPSVELGVGIALLLTANAALHRALSHLPPDLQAQTALEVDKCLLDAVAGQMQDLSYQRLPSDVDVTTDESLAMTELKAGSLGRLTAVIGARMAGANDALTQQISECYACFSTYRQLLDDLSDAPDMPDGRVSDAAQGKRTLPLVYLAHWRDELGASTRDASPGQGHIIHEERRIPPVSAEELGASGATLFTQLAAETFRNRARSIAQQIQRATGRAELLIQLL
jgi:geranylgeranyl pyrophosphate synthase